jgi:hypothetical protein
MESEMSFPRTARWLVPSFFMGGLLLAQAPAEKPTKAETLGKARLEAAMKEYDETWAYFQQARIDSYQVYVWSRIVLDCRREMSPKPADRRTALEEHLARMKKLESLVLRVRKLGFGLSYDVGASAYYRLEAEHWVALDAQRK